MKRLTVAILGSMALCAHAAPTTIGFEDLSDLDPLSNQYTGLAFQGGLGLLSGAQGGSLNEIDFPPHGGFVVAYSDVPLQIDFDSALGQVGAYFSYVGGLRLNAYDAGGTLLGSTDSAFSNNTATGGDPGSQVNEFIGLSGIGDIHRIVIESTDPNGGAFVFDDLSFDSPAAPQGLPEPATWALGTLAALTATATRRRRKA